MSGKHRGACFCGAVEIEATGTPMAMGYCHCGSCRSWSAAPVTAFTIWQADAVKVTKGAEHVGAFSKTERSERQYCTRCGGHLMAAQPLWGVTDVFAGTLPSLPFEPSVHIHYAETVLPIRDGLPKLKDLPEELGGSGESLPE